jgi:hypothetical protein
MGNKQRYVTRYEGGIDSDRVIHSGQSPINIQSHRTRCQYSITREIINEDVVRLKVEYGSRMYRRFTTVTVHKREDIGRVLMYLMDTFESSVDELYLETVVHRYFQMKSQKYKNFIVDSSHWSTIDIEYKHPNAGTRGTNGIRCTGPINEQSLSLAEVSFNRTVLPTVAELLSMIGDAELIVDGRDHSLPIIYNGGEYVIVVDRLLSDLPVIDVTINQRGVGPVAHLNVLRCEFIEKIVPILLEYGFLIKYSVE